MDHFAFPLFICALVLKAGSTWGPRILIVAGLFTPYNVIGETTMGLRYEVQWGNLNVGQVEANWIFSENTYEMVGNSRTVGIWEKVREYRGSSNIKGQIRDGLYKPVKIEITGAYRGKERNAKVIWGAEDGQIVTSRYPELDLRKVHALDNIFIQGSIDPFTAILRALNSIQKTGSCDSNHKIYDGLRTAELAVHDLGSARLTGDRPSAYAGVVIKCGFISKPTGGHQLKSRWNKKKHNIDDIIIFIAEIKPSFFLPVRIEVKTFLGKVTARLVMTDLAINVSG